MPEATEAPAQPRVGTRHPTASAPPEPPPHEFDSGGDDGPAREGRDLIEAAARAGNDKSREKLTEDEQIDALEWFLSDTDDTDLTHTFQMNIGTPTKRRWLTWTVRAVDMDKLRRIRRSSQEGNRRQRRAGGGEFDDTQANVQIVLEGTVAPDLRAAAKQIGVVDPGVALRSRFKDKPGLLAQIAGEIMSLSGYDDEDIREVDAARG